MSGLARWLRHFVHHPRHEGLDLTRRSVIAAGLGGAAAVLLAKAEPLGGRKSFNPALVRPPGSLPEPEFLERCIRCGECMKVCPTGVLQPAVDEGGAEGLWTPFLKMDAGFCEYECTLCGQVCPTDAIQELPIEQKQRVKIGLAYVDRNRCLPFAYGRSCIVCEEHCPTPKKAIWFEEVEVATVDGGRQLLKQPHVDPDLCIGCGICENKCPVADRAAILVTSVGEARNPDNQVLLTNDPYGS
jgi:MauM/NapG family ferredoxin protein